MLPPPIDPTTVIHLAALWNWNRLQRTIDRRVYIRAERVAFIRPERWEPWNDDRLPPVRFLEYFRMSRADFAWLCEELRGTLDQDHLRQGAPLTVEAQVAVGLYRLVLKSHKACTGDWIRNSYIFPSSNNLLEVV
ncbi:uncharacterized protein PGTG_16291 [Puccinia graminis f. sp. tritici CRL 75-36-700-3]|uniref:Uncharacterized protein n=1 Tax=Puccinia graminis f. sp. tritici (strain CRL 75-36-700-3 / race SCCL) TaxID=418459 RepID=E3L170_PUCGT|nr:uncharacterized protein PGTG_16291 [Puccinia graminis f. sp. tritici CRL 75-36-700-3]EFP90265.2 hypothetical protein PGTG_16291 [Puccinia graminis f. sp. tritici CRL 75-36-700-3]